MCLNAKQNSHIVIDIINTLLYNFFLQIAPSSEMLTRRRVNPITEFDPVVQNTHYAITHEILDYGVWVFI